MNDSYSLAGISMFYRPIFRFLLFLTSLTVVFAGEALAQATQVRVETRGDSLGVPVPVKSLASADTLKVYANSRTAAGVFVANVVASTWTLDTLSGGVVIGDLVQSPDGKSATFKAHAVGSAYIRATFSGLTAVRSGKITVVAGPASKLIVTIEPSAAAIAGAIFAAQPTVQVQDANGNVVTTDTTTTVTATTLGGTDSLRGTVTKKAVSGVIAFTNLKYNLAQTIRIRFTGVPSLTPDTSSSIVVSPAAPSKLVFVQQPTNDTAGTIITPPITVQSQDAFSNNVADSGRAVTVFLSFSTGTLSGTTTRSTNAAGLATFNNLTVNLTGAKQLRAGTAGLDTAVSTIFTISPASATKLTLLTQPSASATAGVVFAQQPVIHIQDALGNLVTTDNTTIVKASRSTGLGTLLGDTTLTATGGIVSFTNLKHIVAGSITIQFTSVPVLTPVLSNAVVINTAAASKLIFTQQPTTTSSGAIIAPPLTVQLQDTFSNNVSQSAIPVVMTLSSGTGTLSGTTTQNTSASGVSTFSNLSINLVGSKVLTASRAGLTSAVSNSFIVGFGAPSSIVASSGTPQSALVNTAFATTFQATVRDIAGNLVSGAVVTFTAPTIGAKGTFVGGLTTINVTSDTNGVARATVFTANTVAGSYNVTATVAGVATPATFALTNNPGPARQIIASAGTPQSTPISTAFPTNFQVTVQDTFANPLSGVVVRFTRPASGASGTFLGNADSAVTNVNGIGTASVFVANFVAGTYTVTATAPGIATPAVFSLANTPGSPNQIIATAGTPQTAQVGTAFATNMKVSVKDGANNPVPGTLVTFAKPATGASGTFANSNPILTDSTGVATAPAFTANLVAGNYVVTAAVSGVSSPAIFDLTNISGTPGSITATAGTPQSATVNSGFATNFQVIVRDNVGNPVNNATVRFTSPSTGASGKFGASRTVDVLSNALGVAIAPTFTADTLAGSYQVTASASGVLTPAVFSLTNSPGVASRIVATAGTPQSAVIGTAFATNFKVRVTDSFDNPIAGRVITFTPPLSSASGTFSGNVNTATTDSTGSATAVVFTANLVAGSYTVSATAAGVGTANFVLTNTPGNAASIAPTAGTPQTTIVGTAFSLPLQATVRDGVNNPIAGASVTFTAPVSGQSGTFGNGLTTFTILTNTSGVATATFTANANAGSYSVNARVSGVSSPAVFALTNNPGGASSITATLGTPQSIIVNRAFVTNLQATVRDASGNPVPGILVNFVKPVSGASGTFAGGIESTTTNASGVATAAVFTANIIAGSYTVTAQVTGVLTPASFSLTNLAGAPLLVAATAGTPQSTQVNTPFAANLAVAVRDSFNNPVPNIDVTFTVPLSGASATFTGGVNIARTNAVGVATAAQLTANSIAGAYNVTASVPGVSVPASFSLQNVAGAAASIIATAGTPQSAQVLTPFTQNFRALVRDASLNPVRNATVTFTPPPTGPSGAFSTGNNALTDSNGVVIASQFTANAIAGSYILNATVAGLLTPAQFALTNLSGVASSIVMFSGSPQSATVGTTYGVPLQALVRDASDNPVQGVLVTFTSPTTGATCNFAATANVGTATTNASGVATVVVIANQITGQYNVTATASAISSTANFTLTNTPAPPATITVIAGTPQSTQVGTPFATALQAVVRDAFGNVIPNWLVRFTAPSQTGPSGTFSGGVGTDTVRTNTIGVAVARTLTANSLAGGPYIVAASVAGVTNPANFSLTNLTGPPGSITILAGTPQTAQVMTTFATRFKVAIKDAAANPIPNVLVQFGVNGVGGTFAGGVDSARTDVNGIAEAVPFTANNVAGSTQVNASAPNVSTPAVFQLTSSPGPARKIFSSAGSSQTAQISTAFATQFQATVTDTFDNHVPAGVVVTWTAPTSGASGTFAGNVNTATTDANGVATARVFVANLAAGGYTVTALAPGVVQAGPYYLTNLPAGPATINVTQGSPQTATVNTPFGGRLIATVRDQAGNAVGGRLVTFARPLTGPGGTFAGGIDTVTTGANGEAMAPVFTANSKAGSYTVSATTPPVSQPAQFNLTNAPGAAGSFVVRAGTPQSAQVNTDFATRLEATVRDSFSNPIPNVHVTFIPPTEGASGSFVNNNEVVTNDSGVAIANVFRANSIAGSYIVRASVPALTSTIAYSLTNTPGGPGIVSGGANTSPQTTVVNRPFIVPLSVKVTDASNNPLANVPVTFTAPSSGASGTFPGGGAIVIVPTGADGIAFAGIFRANTSAGRYNVTAVAQGVSQTIVFDLTNAIGAAVRFTSIAGTPQTAQVNSYFATRLRAVVTDSFFNPIPNVRLTFALPSSGASGVFDNSNEVVTSDSGIATANALRANSIAGSYVVHATMPGLATIVDYSLTNSPGGPGNVTAGANTSPQTTVVNTPFGVALSVRVTDASNNPLANVPVTFTAPPAGASGKFLNGTPNIVVPTAVDGIASAGILRANTIAGRYNINVVAQGVSQTVVFDFTNTIGIATQFTSRAGTPQSTQVNTTFATRLQAAIADSFGNPVPNVRVTFSLPASGASGIFDNSNEAVTSDSGVATANSLRANNIAGSYLIRASIPAMPTIVDFNLTNSAGGPGSITNAAGSTPQSTIVNTPFAVALSDTVRDGLGNPLANVPVRFVAPSTGPSGTFDANDTVRVVLTNANGVATAGVFRANTIAGGPYNITATVQGVGGPAIFTLTNLVAPLSKFLVQTETGGAIGQQRAMNPFIIKISASDVFNNIVPSFTGKVKLTSPAGFVADTMERFNNGVSKYRVIVLREGSNISIKGTQLDDSTKNGTSNIFQVVNPVPRIASVTPDSGGLSETVNVTVRGSNFIDSLVTSLYMRRLGVTLVPLSSLNVVDTTQLRATIAIPASADTGVWSITLGNANTAESNVQTFRVVLPIPLPPVLAGPSNASRNTSTTVTFAWLPTPASTYRLQIATDTNFASVVFDSSSIATTFLTLGPPQIQNGTKYFWRVKATNARGTGEFSAIKSFMTIPAYYPSGALTLNTTVPFPLRVSAGDYLVTDYRIVGLPGDGAQGGAKLDQLLGGTQNVDWVVYRDNGGTQDYYKPFSSNDPLFNLAPGRAFWILRKGSWGINSLSVPRVLPFDTTNASVTIQLQSGWNLIANPFDKQVLWSDVVAMNGSLAPIYRFNGSLTISSTLDPYSGYYFKNTGNLPSLKIPFGTSAAALSKPTGSGNAGEWKIDIALIAGDFTDRTTTLGIISSAQEGLDSLEYQKPRMFSEIPSIYFNRPEWDSQFSSFAADFRPTIDRLETWKFEVHAKSRENMVLRFDGVSAVPANFKVYLVDEQRARFVDLRNESGYTFTLPTGSSDFKIVVGTDEAVREILNSVLPKEFALGNNFPNPFNPTTSIPIALPQTAEISLKVYNILGEEVRTVFSGPLEAGRYFFTWDGKNNVGSAVATGTYITRFTTNAGKAFTGKMVLIK